MIGAAASLAVENKPGGNVWPGLDERWTGAEITAAVANIALACAIVWTFHDSFWWPPDDGAYAYVADRLRNGDVLNRDLHDVHAGYVHFLHALAFDLFGRDLVSLRYPLAALTVIQSAIVFLILRPLIGPAAICGGLAMSALTFVQFLNPTPNWYALFLTVLLVALLVVRAERNTLGLVAIGFVIATIFLFRQLTGVLVGFGAVAYLLLPEHAVQARANQRSVITSIIVAATALALAAYLWFKTDSVSFVLYGFWPLATLVLVGVRAELNDRQAARLIITLLAGAAIAALPLVVYHLLHGSLIIWLDDTILSAVSLTDLDFFRRSSYALMLVSAATSATDFGDPIAMLNSVFWLLVLLSPFILGVAVLRALQRDASRIHPLPFLALFHALVSAHYAIPIYALYSAGLTFAGLLAITHFRLSRTIALAATLVAVVVGLGFQAAQPLSRGLDGIMRGERRTLDADGIPGARIRMEKQDQTTYLDLLKFVEIHASPQAAILGLPMTPELYFLAYRKPPVRFLIAPLSLRSERDVQQAWSNIEAAMPAAVIFKPDDKYTTPRVLELMRRLQPHYRHCKTIGSFELYAPACRT